MDTLHTLRLLGMAQALREQLAMPDLPPLSFEERLGLLIDRELIARDTRRFQTRLRQATLRLNASLEDVAYQAPRGLDRSLLLSLASCQWVHDHRNIFITGPTGIGKTWPACAFGQQACRAGDTTLSLRLPRLLQEFPLARGDGRYLKVMASLAKLDVRMRDEWGMGVRSDAQRRALLEVLEDRYERRATVVTSQVPVAHWYEALNHPTLADAILDRLVHNA